MTITTTTFTNVAVGTESNDGTGDTLREAFIKVNENFYFMRNIGLAAANVAAGNAEIVSNLTVGNIITSGYFYANGNPINVGGAVTVVNELDANYPFYPVFAYDYTGEFSNAYVSSTKFTFNPNTGTLTTTNIEASGGNLANLYSITISSNIASTSEETGAVVVHGGAGITGNLHVGGNLDVGGNINALGNLNVITSTSVSLANTLVYFGPDNPADITDAGFVSSFTNPYYQHTGLVRDASDGKWKLFANVVAEPTTTVDFNLATYSTLKVGSLETGNVIATDLTGTLLTGNQPNISNVGTLGNLNVSGNISGTMITAAQPNITTVGNLNALQVAGSITATGTVSGNLGLSGTLLTAAQTNITSVGTLSAVNTSGNLTFTGTGNRIFGDMSNASFASRLAFQSSTTNGATRVSVIPNGTSTSTSFNFFNNSNITNAGRATLGIDNTEVYIQADINGSGTYLPLSIYTNALERIQVDTGGNVLVGVSTSTATGYLRIGHTTASTTSTNGALRVGGGAGIAGNLHVGGNVSASFYTGNGSLLTGIVSSYGNTNVAAYLTSQSIQSYGNTNVASYLTSQSIQSYGNANVASYLTSQSIQSYGNANVASYLPTYSGNVTSLTVTGSVTTRTIKETVTLTAAAPAATEDIYLANASVRYHTVNASANFTANIRGSVPSGTVDSLMSVGESISIALLVTNGATPYYPNAVRVDNTVITPRFQNGTAFSAGNANSVDVYTYTVIKTAAATFTVLASQTRFA